MKRLTAAQEHGRRMRASGRSYRGGYTRSEQQAMREEKEITRESSEEKIQKPKFKKGQVWNKPKTALMEVFEKETGKNAIRAGKITGNFEYWLWIKIKKQKKKK